MEKDFFKGKKIFITGHRGFKGAWLCSLLYHKGAKICGYSRNSPKEPHLYNILKLDEKINSVDGDIRDGAKLRQSMNQFRPEIVIHLAAQPIVRISYEKPVETFETNVMGTVNLLEAVRLCEGVKSLVNITTDKVYENKEWHYGYRESDNLNGFDPYSNSKSCSELVTSCFVNSYFKQLNIAASTVRAGNVIGGGDFAPDRIIPDCIRATLKREPIVLRNPNATRPYQHVLDVLYAYLLVASSQYNDLKYSGYYNIGPNNEDCVSTQYLANLFCKTYGENVSLHNTSSVEPHEANLLQLDSSKIRNTLDWKPRWDIKKAVEKTVEWTKCYYQKEDIIAVTNTQIKEFLSSKL